MRTFILAISMGLWAALATSVFAAELKRPGGETILTVRGGIAVSNVDGAASFDMAMLVDMPSTSFVTTTIWTDGEKTFTGVPLAQILLAVQGEGTSLRATAINDYTVEIPLDSISADYPIVAYEMDGAQMSRRQKGPLWIVYPYDSDASLRSEVIYSRSIWQLDRLEIVE